MAERTELWKKLVKQPAPQIGSEQRADFWRVMVKSPSTGATKSIHIESQLNCPAPHIAAQLPIAVPINESMLSQIPSHSIAKYQDPIESSIHAKSRVVRGAMGINHGPVTHTSKHIMANTNASRGGSSPPRSSPPRSSSPRGGGRSPSRQQQQQNQKKKQQSPPRRDNKNNSPKRRDPSPTRNRDHDRETTTHTVTRHVFYEPPIVNPGVVYVPPVFNPGFDLIPPSIPVGLPTESIYYRSGDVIPEGYMLLSNNWMVPIGTPVLPGLAVLRHHIRGGVIGYGAPPAVFYSPSPVVVSQPPIVLGGGGGGLVHRPSSTVTTTTTVTRPSAASPSRQGGRSPQRNSSPKRGRQGSPKRNNQQQTRKSRSRSRSRTPSPSRTSPRRGQGKPSVMGTPKSTPKISEAINDDPKYKALLAERARIESQMEEVRMRIMNDVKIEGHMHANHTEAPHQKAHHTHSEGHKHSSEDYIESSISAQPVATDFAALK